MDLRNGLYEWWLHTQAPAAANKLENIDRVPSAIGRTQRSNVQDNQ